MAVTQKSNECQLDQAVEQQLLVTPLTSLVSSLEWVPSHSRHKTTVSNHEGAREFSKEQREAKKIQYIILENS